MKKSHKGVTMENIVSHCHYFPLENNTDTLLSSTKGPTALLYETTRRITQLKSLKQMQNAQRHRTAFDDFCEIGSVMSPSKNFSKKFYDKDTKMKIEVHEPKDLSILTAPKRKIIGTFSDAVNQSKKITLNIKQQCELPKLSTMSKVKMRIHKSHSFHRCRF